MRGKTPAAKVRYVIGVRCGRCRDTPARWVAVVQENLCGRCDLIVETAIADAKKDAERRRMARLRAQADKRTKTRWTNGAPPA